MSEVWVAADDAGASFAIKLMKGDLDVDDAAERMLAEVRALARIRHPGIVRAHDVGRTAAGDPFIVMDLMEGESLGDRLGREQRLPALEAVRVMMDVADALALAHSCRVVHRDLKPENIFLAQEPGGERARILDFGIAMLEADTGAQANPKQHGGLIGSPDYMSPEQILDGYVDHRTDLWSFCVVLYEAVSGRLPFERDGAYEVLRAVVNDMPTPLSEHHAGDAALWSILQRGLEKDPEQRWQSIRELGEALFVWMFEHGAADVLSATRTSCLRSEPSGSLSRGSSARLASAIQPHPSVLTTAPPPASEGAAAPRVSGVRSPEDMGEPDPSFSARR